MKNELFVTAGEVAQELGVSKPFAYKLVRQMNEELEKGFIRIAGHVSRKYMSKIRICFAGASCPLIRRNFMDKYAV